MKRHVILFNRPSGLSARKRPLAIVVGFVAALLSAAAATACHDLSGSDTSVLSLRFDSLPSPSVVLGDTLRDSTGAIVHPTVHAFDFNGEEIADATVFFLSPDSGVTVDSATGIIVGDSLRSTPARIVATIAGLQAIQRLDVTLRPDLIAGEHVFDSLSYSITDTTLNVSPALTVKLTHGTAPNDSAVKSYIVSFQIVSQPDPPPGGPPLSELVNDNGKASIIDTTDASGIAGRKIRLHLGGLISGTQVDSIIVNATAKYHGTPVTGSPVRLVMKFKPRS
jgi:hypothetical protein